MGALLGAPMDLNAYLDAYDFDLPEDRIALRPAQPRDAARLLHVNGEALADRFVRDLPSLLNPGDVLVVNDTRVTPAALKGQRPPRAVKAGETPGAGAAIDVNLIRREDSSVWTALARPGKRLRVDDIIVFAEGVEAQVVSKQDAGAGGEVRLAFNASGAELDATISAIGFAPLPPYIARRRPADARDRADYQTVFAREEGAVAAPTAGLHFTPELLAALDARGVSRVPVTLHVGDGTFAPLDAAALSSGRLHAERCVLTAQAADALNSARAAGGRIVAISSLAGLVGQRGQVNYSASKAGLIGAVKALAQELAKRGITVNSVAPGLTETDMIEGAPVDDLRKMIPMRRLGRPEEIASVVAFLCSAGAS